MISRSHLEATVGTLAWIFVAVAAWVHMTRFMFADPDLFVTLYAGREIAQHGFVPYVDTVSFTVAGQPWTDYEWLARLAFHHVYSSWGGAGLVVMRWLLCATVVGLLFAHARSYSKSFAAFLCCMAFFGACASSYFLFRPTLFSFAGITALLLLIERARAGRSGLLWIVPPAMVVWCNVHAGFALGVVVLGFVAFESLLAVLGRGLTVRMPSAVGAWLDSAAARALPLRTSFGCLAVSLLASGLNPFGYSNWFAIFETLGGRITPYLSEWKPMYAGDSWRFWPVWLLLALVVIVLVAGRRWVGWFDIALLLALGTASVQRVRFIPLFTIAATMFLMRVLPPLAAGIAHRSTAIRSGAAAPYLALVTAAAIAVAAWVFEGPRDLKIRMVEGLTPVAGVKFLEENGIAGRILNEYDWGGYIRFKLPRALIFCDGRSDTVYPGKITGQFARFVRARDGWATIPDEYGAEVVVLRRQMPVVQLLGRTPGWIAAYIDAYTAIFLRDVPANAEHIARLRAGAARSPTLVPADYVLP